MSKLYAGLLVIASMLALGVRLGEQAAWFMVRASAQAPAATTAVPAVVQQPGTDLGMKPIAAPPLPINASKQDRLAALLQKYQADQITPDEYHSQRAAILAEP